MTYRHVLLVLTFTGTAGAQSAIQFNILNKITSQKTTIPCTPVPGAGSLKGAVCGERGGDPAMGTSPNPNQRMEYPEWLSIGPSSYFNIWNSSVARYPVYLSRNLKTEYDAQVTVAAAGASLPPSISNKGSTSPSRAAGATRGAGYTDAGDVREFAIIQQSGKLITLMFGARKLTFTLGQKTAKLDGKSVPLQSVPFMLDNRVYYPVGLFKILGCTVLPTINEAFAVGSTEVSCVVNGRRKTAIFKNWTY
jgi:hypothetical protein